MNKFNFNYVENGPALSNNNKQEIVPMNSSMSNNASGNHYYLYPPYTNNFIYNPRPSTIEEMIALDDFLQKELQNVLNYLFHQFPKDYLVPLYKRKPRFQQFVNYNKRPIPSSDPTCQRGSVNNPLNLVSQETQGPFQNFHARENLENKRNNSLPLYSEQKTQEEIRDLNNYRERHPFLPVIFEEGYSSEDSYDEGNLNNLTLDFYNSAALQMMHNNTLQVGNPYSYGNTFSNSAPYTGAVPKVRPQNTFADFFTDGLLGEMNARIRAKTKLCRNYELNGDCSYGQKCQFAHGHVELRSPRHLPNYKTRKCNTFHLTGFCEYGVHCRYIHYSFANPHLSSIEESVPFEFNDNDSEWPYLPAQEPSKNTRNKKDRKQKSKN